MKKVKIFVCTHGKFGEELMRSAEMIAGPFPDAVSFSLLPGMSPENYLDMIEEKAKTVNGSILCLTDLFGGTPCTTCALLAKKYDMQILTGLNLAMYLEITSQLETIGLEELCDLGLRTLKDSGKNVLSLLR